MRNEAVYIQPFIGTMYRPTENSWLQMFAQANFDVNGNPIRFDATPAEIRRPAPGLGEHNEELLTELGFDEAAIGELREAGVLGG